MKKIAVSLLIITGMAFTTLSGQKYFTREGTASFYSDAPLEKIEAVNNAVTSVLDTESGRAEFAILIKAFQFKKALMQVHFNETYMESSLYPKAIFKGKIEQPEAVDFFSDGEYPVVVNGKLTIHGVTNDIKATGKIVVKKGAISAAAFFDVAVADYKIDIPGIVRNKIAEIVRVSVAVDYQEFKKKS
jgi:YceI-like domain